MKLVMRNHGYDGNFSLLIFCADLGGKTLAGAKGHGGSNTEQNVGRPGGNYGLMNCLKTV